MVRRLAAIAHPKKHAALEAAGYFAAHNGQKTYNGVAILSKFPISDEVRHLPGEPEDEQSRYLEVLIEAPRLLELEDRRGAPFDREPLRQDLSRSRGPVRP